MRRIIVTLLMLMCLHIVHPSYGKDSELTEWRHQHEAGFIFRPGYILPTNGYYCGFNPLGIKLTDCASLAFQYSFAFSENTRYGRLFPSARQGIGIGLYSFGSHEHIGTPLSLYIFQGATIASLAERLTLDYEWNLGLSYGWVNKGKLTATKANICLGGGFFLTWRPHPGLKLTIGPEFSHYSNGDTAFPNLGTNTLTVRTGASVAFGNRIENQSGAGLFASGNQIRSFAERVTCDIVLAAGSRAGRFAYEGKIYEFNKSFPIALLSVNPVYHFNRCLSLGPSLDVTFDRSADLIYAEDDGYALPSVSNQIGIGAGVRTEVRMNIFALNGGAGYSFCHNGSDLSGLYGIFGLKTFLGDRLFLNMTYILRSKRYTHNLTFGLGWRIGGGS